MKVRYLHALFLLQETGSPAEHLIKVPLQNVPLRLPGCREKGRSVLILLRIADKHMTKKRPLILAHRGFSGKYPENSPIAFEKAVELTDADGFESDVHISKDGVLVVMHDAEVDRTSDGHGFIKDMTYEELLKLDIGSWKGPEFAGQHIWTFDQLLEFCDKHEKLLNIELKNYEVFYEGLEEKVIAAIRAHKMEDRVFISSFNHISIQKCKELAPEIEAGLLYDKPFLDMEEYISRSKADNMHPRYMLLQYQEELIPMYHKHGMKVYVFTVNDEENVKDMIERGVDGMISNFPDMACRVEKEMLGE